MDRQAAASIAGGDQRHRRGLAEGKFNDVFERIDKQIINGMTRSRPSAARGRRTFTGIRADSPRQMVEESAVRYRRRRWRPYVPSAAESCGPDRQSASWAIVIVALHRVAGQNLARSSG